MVVPAKSTGMNVSSALASIVPMEPAGPPTYPGFSLVPVCATEMDRADSSGPAKSVQGDAMTKTRENAWLVQSKTKGGIGGEQTDSESVAQAEKGHGPACRNFNWELTRRYGNVFT